jgi:hypothetical protein
LGEAKYYASLSRDGIASLNGVSVTLAELEELFRHRERGTPRISPKGAALLLRLFEQGAFDHPECRPVEGGLELLAQYSKGLATMIESAFWRKPRRPRSPVLSQRFEHSRIAAADVPIAHRPMVSITVHRLM